MQPFRRSGPPDGRAPLLLSSPHSGTLLPAAFLHTARLPESLIRRMEDSHVNRLLAPAAAQGVPLIEAVVSRAALDLNRAADEIDPVMFDDIVVDRPRLTDRVRRGHGLFPRVAGGGQAIHGRRLDAVMARNWIAHLHQPFHAAISDELLAARARHGHAVLLDVHSMPTLEGPRPAAIVLGDRHGRSAAPALTEWLHNHFLAAGYLVRRNIPYAGGHITEHHASPREGIHAVQIEIDRALYMDSVTLVPHAGFAVLAAFLAKMVEALLAAIPFLGLEPPMAMAAE